VTNDFGGDQPLPRIIQGGMGVGVSSWRLARAVSAQGQLGVVSGTALDQMLVRRLQDGDPEGHVREALRHFPAREIADRIVATYHVPGGKAPADAYATLPMHAVPLARTTQELCVVANFVEVWLARQGHGHPVGINYLEKIQIPHLPSLYGAMLAGVGYVLMGAGIPLKIPGAIDRLARHEPATYPLAVTGSQPGDDHVIAFDPRDVVPGDMAPLTRPAFLAIVSSAVLATTLLKRANGRVDGFVVEGPTAGGHNAPPRGKPQLDAEGQPVYGERDRVDLGVLRSLGLPFWLAGGYGTPERLRDALDEGAAGVQVGTAFAYCEESGLRDDHKRAIAEEVRTGSVRVITDPLASPTGFPFKIVDVASSIADPAVYQARPRICDLGYLREAFRTADGTIEYRCAAEPVSVYVSKGGAPEDTVNRKCLCNALIASAGHPQVRAGRHVEPGIVTSGDALDELKRFMPAGTSVYGAADVIRTLLHG
jgi:nitronate monooxygenase